MNERGMKRFATQAGLWLVILALPLPGWANSRVNPRVNPSSDSGIRPDRTLPNPSQVQRAPHADPNTRPNTTVITGGTQVGRNLFHSFRTFSVPDRGTASFRGISPDVTRIFTRVTGGSVSRINGLLEALDATGAVSRADFFLINPSGILFGRNAALNLGGSFLATTASRVRFQDNLSFTALDPAGSELLSISVPVGLQFNSTPASPGLIRNQSRRDLVLDPFGQPIAGGLQVRSGATLALLGQSVELDGGFLTAPAGRIELGSVVRGEVRLNLLEGPLESSLENQMGSEAFGRGLAGLDYGNARLGTMRLTNLATVNASGEAGGAIQLRADQIDLAGSSLIVSDTGAANGADITIRANRLTLTDFSLVTATATGSGSGGNIRVAVGQLTADAGGQLSTRALGSGDAGNLTVAATEQVRLSGRNSVLPDGSFSPTGLFSQTDLGSGGNGGRLAVTTPLLQLQNGASLATDTSGAGQAGRLEIRADRAELSGVLRNSSGAVVLDQGLPLPSGIFADSNASATGAGGAIQLDTASLRLRDGAVVQTNAEGPGNAGRLTIRAADRIDLSGAAGPDLPPTAIFAASGGLPGQDGGGSSTATGRGGSLRLVTPELQVSDRAVVAVGSLNPNQEALGAGNLRIESDRLRLDNQGRLVAETNSGDGGNISLQVQDSLVLRRHSRISTSAGIENRGGNGGNIAIETEFVIAPAIENSDIRANAFTGNGGNVTITAEGILGIQPRQQPTNLSDITASSEFGTPGQVIIRSPDVNPDATPPELAAAPLSNRPALGCATGEATTAEFFNRGRSGLPLSPYEPLSSSEVLADLRRPSEFTSESTAAAVTPTGSGLTEAQGWVINDKGAVVLVATTPSGCRL